MSLQEIHKAKVAAEISRIASRATPLSPAVIAARAAKALIRDHPDCGMSEQEILDAIVRASFGRQDGARD